MYNFDPYNVLLAISTDIACAAYDCFCAARVTYIATKMIDQFIVFLNECLLNKNTVDIYLQRFLMLYVVDPFK